jgi:uncharacterized protein Yka (UPF0111/DUF47 family)
MSNNSPDDLAQALRDLFDRFNLGGVNTSVNRTIDSLDDFSKTLDSAEKNAGKLNDAHDDLRSNMDKNVKFIGDNSAEFGKLTNRLSQAGHRLEQLGEEVKSAERAYESLGASATQEQRDDARRRLERLRGDHERATAEHAHVTTQLDSKKKLDQGATELKASFGKLVDGVLGVTKDLLQGSNSVAFSTGVLTKGIDVSASGLKAAGSAFDGLGDILSLGGPIGKVASLFAKGLGMAFEGLAKSAEFAKEGVEILGQEVQKTVNSYQTLASAGATFAGGMEEMRELSQSSGMGLESFTRIVKENAADFSAAGLGMTGAAKKFATISKSMSETGLREQIFNLGYSFEEFGGLTADVMAQLNSAGQLNFKSDQEIGQLTLDYAKNLRMISNITGEDAKKKMDEARKSSLRAGVYEKVMQMGGKEGLDKFQKMMTVIPKSMEQGVLEFVASGGTAVRDIGLNLAMQQTPALRDALVGMVNSIEDPAQDAAQATDSLLTNFKTVRDQMGELTTASGHAAMGLAAIFGTGGAAQEYATFATAMREFTLRIPEDIAEYRRKLDETAAAPGKLTTDLSKLNDDYQIAKATMEGIASTVLPAFSGVLGTATTAVGDFASKVNATIDWIGGKVKVNEELSRPANVGSAWSSVGMPGRRAGAAAAEANSGSLPGKALGGISVGPKSGYMEKLHGVEAVVPLPDGRSIPVSMESGGFTDLVNLMREQIKIAQDMVATLRDSQDIQDRLLANSY